MEKLTSNTGNTADMTRAHNRESLLARARKLGLNPADVLEAFGHANEMQADFDRARAEGDLPVLWSIFQKSQQGSVFAKKVLEEILSHLNTPDDVAEMWKVYHLSSGECDLAEEILHKINIHTSLLQNWMEVIRFSKTGDVVHEEAVRFARLHTDSRDVLWTLFHSTENYALRNSILAKILMLSRTMAELKQVIHVAEHGYPELRNRCIRQLLALDPRETRGNDNPSPKKPGTGAVRIPRPLGRATSRRVVC